jgi:hypothetical protein
MLIPDLFPTFQLTNMLEPYAFKTSDGAFYPTGGTHTWDATQDKQCVVNDKNVYKTRWVIIYSDIRDIRLWLNNTNVKPLYLYFGDCNLTSVIIGSSYQNQSDRFLEAFVCSSLTTAATAAFPSNAFTWCSNLIKIDIPQGLGSLGSNCFENCFNLREVNLPTTYSYSYPDRCFKKCYNLRKIDIRGNSLGLEVFSGSGITYVKLPDTLTTVSYSVFNSCSDLKTIIFPSSLASIGRTTATSAVFSYCSSLTEVLLPEGVTLIGHSCFSYNTTLRNVYLPLTLRTISAQAFEYDYGLNTIYIPDGVTSIGSYTFRNCENLTYIRLPNSLTSYDTTALTNCYALSTVEVQQNFDVALSLSYSAFITKNSMISIFNNLKDNTGLTAKTLSLGTTNLAKLTAEEKAIATNKNWTLA